MTPAFEALGTHYIKCCATCKHWIAPLVVFGGLKTEDFSARECSVNNRMVTLDLALCSRWEEKEDAE
jgi:hypothetical protein